MRHLLAEVGEALYGQQWQRAIARDLGVSDRTVRRWVAGGINPPGGIHADLLSLVQARAAGLRHLADRIESEVIAAAYGITRSR